MEELTPMLAQYRAIKQEHQDVVLLFRLGDFYEMFGEDAKLAAQVLDLTLTSREIGKGRRLPMCGVPYHAVDRYLARLLAAGHKAAICEQVEDPRQAKGLVKREVTRILTPGTVVEEFLLEERRNNYLAAVSGGEAGWGLAVVDSSTGEFLTTQVEGEGAEDRLLEELGRLGPAEVLVSAAEAAQAGFTEMVQLACRCRVTSLEEEAFLLEAPYQVLTRHFGVVSLRGFGCEELPLAVEAAAMALHYLQSTQKCALRQIRSLSTYSLSQFMILDTATRRNLELTISLRDGSRANSLLWLLDDTQTAMGARALRRWLLAPLLSVEEINNRLELVDALLADDLYRAELRASLKQLHDLERVTSRAATGTAHPRDLAGMRDSLALLPRIISLLREGGEALAALAEGIDPLSDLAELLAAALEDQPPLSLRDGGLIRPGYSPDLDALRELSRQGKDWIASLEQRERVRTGIKSLRVAFNQVFGYYLEVTRPNLELVPADYIRKQTLANAERFITPELKEYEARVLGAEEKMVALECTLFCALRNRVAEQAGRIQDTARRLAELDVLTTFAEISRRHHYCRPQVVEGDQIMVRDGRHPVVEQTLVGERFVPNDVQLDCREYQLLIITGPNMAGKSTYLRQVALPVLMAQVGCYVPAAEATIGVVDRIFTRVGASDDLATGQSTFMVEMTETANILHNATRHSLVILDEIGRGTSTFDGLSLAWAVAEHLHNHPRMGAKTLFATHYHHLNELEKTLPRCRNYRVAVKEDGERIVFLRKIVAGGTDRSYGIQVARLAGLPQEVVERAKEVLWSLEQSDSIGKPAARLPAPRPPAPPAPGQLGLFGAAEPDPLLEELKGIPIDTMSPLQALNKLAELQARARGKRDHRPG